MKAIDSPRSNFEYFYDSDHYVVAINSGFDGFFERNGIDNNVPWRYIQPGSLRWDSLHQDIYYAHHDFDKCPIQIVSTLPKLPKVPKHKWMKWEDNFLPLDSMGIEKYPRLTECIQENQNYACFWFILHEDLYETYFGDGKFLYCHGEILQNQDEVNNTMSKAIDAASKEEPPYKDKINIKIKKAIYRIENETIIPVDCLPNIYEDYSIEIITERIEEILESEGIIKWGERDDKRTYIKYPKQQ